MAFTGMMVVVFVIVMVIMRMLMIMGMLAVVQPLARPRSARILAEHERFDRDRHGIGRHADAAEIDIVEIPQHDAVDGK
jgi:hypothetical protein